MLSNEQRELFEAKLEAKKLSKALEEHKRRENELILKNQDLINKNNDNFVEQGEHLHLDDKLINALTAGQEAVSKIQEELEGRIQKDLDQLTIIANNKYAGGHHVYDY